MTTTTTTTTTAQTIADALALACGGTSQVGPHSIAEAIAGRRRNCYEDVQAVSVVWALFGDDADPDDVAAMTRAVEDLTGERAG